MILLSILIPTTPDRKNVVCNIISEISRQINENNYHYSVQLIVDEDNREVSIGAKRQRMHTNAKGIYCWSIDSDDAIHHNALKLIMNAIKEHNADCITFKEHCIINGQVKTCNHSLKYEGWGNNKDGYDYVRTPYFKDVIKTSILQQVQVPDLRFSEDHVYSNLIRPLLKTEHHIDEELYIYIYNHTPFKERYGIK